MISIDQLLESVDLDFEPRFVTKDESGIITIWSDRPSKDFASNTWIEQTDFVVLHLIKLADFENKPWQECIYEVPRKTTGKIEHIQTRKSIDCSDTPEAHIEKHRLFVEIWDKINELVDAVNELKGTKNV